MDIADITDALTLWRRLVSGAIGRFGAAVRGGRCLPASSTAATRRARWIPPCCCAPTGNGVTVSAKVIVGIVDSGILDDDDQDRLADTLLWHEQVHYRHPYLVDRHHLRRTTTSTLRAPGRTIQRRSQHTHDGAPFRYGRRCGPGPPAVSSFDAEH